MLRIQPSLPGFGLGKGRLFPKGVLERHLDEHSRRPLPGGDGCALVIADWVSAIAKSSATELTLDPQFLNVIMCDVLGYVAHPTSPSTVWAKPPTSLTHTKGPPDAVLGDFVESSGTCTAVIELKSPGTNLDKPQSGPGYGNRTPVDQAFDYARETFPARWVIVSDMLLIRLYAIDSQDDYEELDLRKCVTDTDTGKAELRKLHLLLHQENLNKGREQSPVSVLYGKSADQRIELREGFYEGYAMIRADLYQAIERACSQSGIAASEVELLQATQRLLDRLMFVYYCEDHPQGLIPNGTIERVVQAASLTLGPGTGKVYEQIKLLFREVDAGSPTGSPLTVDRYNGELFKDHPIIDHIELPDSLNKRDYAVTGPGRKTRRIQGVWGLHVYDFWAELNEHLMGHVFEESLSDLDDLLAASRGQPQKWQQRKKHGIFYTTDILSDFLVRGVLTAALDSEAPRDDWREGDGRSALAARIDHLSRLRIADFACGSGAFLVSAYREMMREFWRLSSALGALTGHGEDLFSAAQDSERSEVIRHCVMGIDLLPQAVEIAKLSLWLNSVQKGQAVNDLSGQIVSGDSLDVTSAFDRLGQGPGTFDIVIGNPPWGGEVEPTVRSRCVAALQVTGKEGWDSWELFLLLALRALRPGGRLALLVPDSFFYPEKASIRRILFDSTTVEMVYSLGPDWFGSAVRMGTVAIQARLGPPAPDAKVRYMALAGNLRREAIAGKASLTQVESLRSHSAPQSRTLRSPAAEVEVFRGERDDRIMDQMASESIALSALCDRGRGEEMNKAGLAWRCPSCQYLTLPGAKVKGGGYANKKCPNCELTLRQGNVQTASLVSGLGQSGASLVGFIDGDDLALRYAKVTPSKRVATDLLVDAKPEALYTAPKILIREAGVGMSATLDETGSRCPRSVYVYRVRDGHAAEGYRNEFVLAVLLSRTLNFYILKRYGETDPAKAFAKLRHHHLACLPIPRVDFSDGEEARAHGTIVSNVRKLLDGQARNGGQEDLEIEAMLRRLWGVTAEDGAYINGEFYDLPAGQLVRSLFPNGVPLPVRDGPTPPPPQDPD